MINRVWRTECSTLCYHGNRFFTKMTTTFPYSILLIVDPWFPLFKISVPPVSPGTIPSVFGLTASNTTATYLSGTYNKDCLTHINLTCRPITMRRLGYHAIAYTFVRQYSFHICAIVFLTSMLRK